MGHWGVKSYENDDASDALEAGFDRVHGAAYDDLMDDRCPLSYDQVHQKFADAATLAAAVEALYEAIDRPYDDWDEVERLAYVGVVVRHAEFGVPIPDEVRLRALDWLEHEDIDWEEATARRLRKDRETALLRKSSQ